MKKINLKGVSGSLNTLKSFVTANSPVLLVGAAITGVVTTGVLAAKAGYEARGRVDDAELEKMLNNATSDTVEDMRQQMQEPFNRLTTQEKAQLTAPLYVAPVIAAGTSIAAVTGVHVIHNKRHAAMAGLYAMATSRLDDVQEKAEELLGAKKSQQLQNDVAQKNVDRNGFTDNQVLLTGTGDQLFYDSFTDRWFVSSVNEVEAAVNNLNEMIVHDGHASLNDWYDCVGLKGIPIGDTLGWRAEQIAIGFSSVLTKEQNPAVSYHFRTQPKEGYNRSRA